MNLHASPKILQQLCLLNSSSLAHHNYFIMQKVYYIKMATSKLSGSIQVRNII